MDSKRPPGGGLADKPQKLSTSEVVFTEPKDKTVLAPGLYVKLTPSQPLTPLRGAIELHGTLKARENYARFVNNTISPLDDFPPLTLWVYSSKNRHFRSRASQ
jgi:hypothetical protein